MTVFVGEFQVLRCISSEYTPNTMNSNEEMTLNAIDKITSCTLNENVILVEQYLRIRFKITVAFSVSQSRCVTISSHFIFKEFKRISRLFISVSLFSAVKTWLSVVEQQKAGTVPLQVKTRTASFPCELCWQLFSVWQQKITFCI